jgi:ubiquinone/menaquinone biosynthesis C-methylase UbiE
MSGYVLDNAKEQAGERFASLESCLDVLTTRQLSEIGVAAGWSCLEVGGGGGSIARWLGDRVGPAGQVVVTDINPR